MAKIKNIIFDFGGVLVDLDKQLALGEFSKLGIDAAPYIDAYAQKGAFGDFEMGLISETDFCRQLRQLTAMSNVSDESLLAAWNSMLLSIPQYKLEWILSKCSEYRIFLLSNTNTTHWKRAETELFTFDGHRVEDFFEKCFLSFEMKQAKPDEGIFQIAIGEASIMADETLFIDDSARNCETARRVGLNVYMPAAHEDWRDKIDEIIREG